MAAADEPAHSALFPGRGQMHGGKVMACALPAPPLDDPQCRPPKRACSARQHHTPALLLLPDDLLLTILRKAAIGSHCMADVISMASVSRKLRQLVHHPLVVASLPLQVVSVPIVLWSAAANRILALSALAGNTHACYHLGMIRLYCYGDAPSGLTLLTRAAGAQHAHALYSLAVIEFNGSARSHCERNPRGALALCARAVTVGQCDALFELGHCMLDGLGTPANREEGRRLLAQAKTWSSQAQGGLAPLAHGEAGDGCTGKDGGSSIGRTPHSRPGAARGMPPATVTIPPAECVLQHAPSQSAADEAEAGSMLCSTEARRWSSLPLRLAAFEGEERSSTGHDMAHQGAEIPLTRSCPWKSSSGFRVCSCQGNARGAEAESGKGTPGQSHVEYQLPPEGLELAVVLDSAAGPPGSRGQTGHVAADSDSAEEGGMLSREDPSAGRAGVTCLHGRQGTLCHGQRESSGEPHGWAEAPVTPAHQFMVDWWAAVLGAEKKGRHANGYARGTVSASLEQRGLCSNELCGRREIRPREFRCCASCREAKYCSRACQARDWRRGHRVACALLTAYLQHQQQQQLLLCQRFYQQPQIPGEGHQREAHVLQSPLSPPGPLGTLHTCRSI